MLKKIIALIILAAQILSANTFVGVADDKDKQGDEIVLYVSAGAKSGGDGSADNPFSSVNGAREKIRESKHTDKTVRVKILPGKYYLNDTITFSSKDSGTDDYPVIYEAAGNGDVIFKGSKEIDFTQFRPITDPKTAARLSPGMLNHVGVIDLRQFGFTPDMIDFIANTQRAVYEYPTILGIYLNGQKQPLSKYPNDGWLTVQKVVKVGGRYPNYAEEDNGDVIEIPNVSNLEKWIGAPDIQIQGYISAEYAKDWRQIKSIDINTRELTFLKYSQGAPMKNGRFQILNLLEEIDMPGEWYVDKRTCEMYYYPSHNLNEKDSLTIATLNKRFVSFEGAKNIILKGLTFEENANSGIVLDAECENIKIQNCKLKNIGGKGIIVDGKNNLVSGCTFEATSKMGVELDGGDMATLTRANNEVSNCHFYNTGVEGGGNSDGGVNITGCGNKFKFNTMHHIENYPISYYSCECDISNNEIFNNIRNTADAAVIYTGRSFLYQGNKIQYNFIHDNTMFDYTSGLGSHAIAFDDWSSGNDVSWNIIYMGKKTGTVSASSPGSRDTVLTYNTNICSTSGNIASYRDVPEVFTTTGAWGSTLRQLFQNSQRFDTSNAKWSSRYSSYDKIIEDIKADNNQILPRNQVIVGNLAVDCVNTQKYYNEEVLTPERNNVIEGNVSLDTYDVFVDPDALDYRVKASAIKEYNISDKILNENNWDMNRMGVQDNILKLEKPSKPFYKIYPRNGAEGIQRNQALISWEAAEYADEYYYVVATDGELKNIVAEGRTMNTTVRVEGLKNGENYYWNVWAKNISRKNKNEWVSGEVPYLFSVAGYDDLNKTVLKESIKRANKYLPLINESSQPVAGEFKTGTKDALAGQINKAENEYKKSFNSQDNIDNAAHTLDKFIYDIDGYRYMGYENLSLNGEKDIDIQSSSCAVTYDNKTVKAVPLTAGMDAHISLNKQIDQSNAVFRFRLKLDSINGYSCISVRNTQPEMKTYSTQAYSVVLKPDVIEFQKGARVMMTHPNDVVKGPVKNGQWHDWEIVTADVAGGVEFRLSVDGQELIHYYDNDEALHQAGTFVINTFRDMTFELGEPTERIEGIYEPDEAFIKKNDSIIKNNTDSSLVLDGSFSESSIKGYNEKPLLVSDGKKASAMWDGFYDAGYYKISYYHKPVENGDKNAKIVMESGGGISGSTEFTVPVDFSGGKEGWVDLGTILIMEFDGRTGEFKFTVSTEGEGVIPVSAVRLVESTEEQKQITDHFYTKNKNVLLLKPGSKKAFRNMGELSMAKEPVIENDRTLVPLRFVSEAFGCNVSWVDTEKKAVIEKDGHIIEFIIGKSCYYINKEKTDFDQPAVLIDDSTMVPIRAISDALGKECYWDDIRKLIFICDSFGLNPEDSAPFEACAKLFG